jgi:hypothetical protein
VVFTPVFYLFMTLVGSLDWAPLVNSSADLAWVLSHGYRHLEVSWCWMNGSRWPHSHVWLLAPPVGLGVFAWVSGQLKTEKSYRALEA